MGFFRRFSDWQQVLEYMREKCRQGAFIGPLAVFFMVSFWFTENSRAEKGIPVYPYITCYNTSGDKVFDELVRGYSVDYTKVKIKRFDKETVIIVMATCVITDPNL